MDRLESKLWQNFDFILLLITLLLVGMGLAMVYSATNGTLEEGASFTSTPVFRQMLYAGIGLVLMMIAAGIDYRIYSHLSRYILIFMLGSLIVVTVLGRMTYGSRRWIDFGLFPFQPSEIAKLLIVLVLAKFLADHEDDMKQLPVLIGSMLISIPPIVLVYLQPDLGTVAVMAAIWLGMIIMAGIRTRYLAIMGGFLVLALPAIYTFILRGYMRERIDTFLDPASDPLGAGYNVLQSEISVGSGGLFGKGYLNGTQSQLHFLRVQHTDFIFSVIGEELGFLGAMILFILFALLLLRGLRSAWLARDTFGRLVATGIVIMILTQVFINIGVNIRLMPVTGIPLPFISAGGSSLLTVLISLGIVQSVVMRHKKIEF